MQQYISQLKNFIRTCKQHSLFNKKSYDQSNIISNINKAHLKHNFCSRLLQKCQAKIKLQNKSTKSHIVMRCKQHQNVKFQVMTPSESYLCIFCRCLMCIRFKSINLFNKCLHNLIYYRFCPFFSLYLTTNRKQALINMNKNVSIVRKQKHIWKSLDLSL